MFCAEKLDSQQAAGYLPLAAFGKCPRKRGTWLIAGGNKLSGCKKSKKSYGVNR
jgi:hypothetical protein